MTLCDGEYHCVNTPASPELHHYQYRVSVAARAGSDSVSALCLSFIKSTGVLTALLTRLGAVGNIFAVLQIIAAIAISFRKSNLFIKTKDRNCLSLWALIVLFR